MLLLRSLRNLHCGRIFFTVCITLLFAGCSDKSSNRRGDPGELSPLGDTGEVSARIQGKSLDDSLAFYKKSLVVLLRLHGEANEEVADTYEKMACVYKEKGDRVGTIEYFGKALNSRKQIFRRDHPVVLQTLKNFADAYMEVGEFNSAIRFYSEFQLSGIKLYGSTHPDMLESYEKVGDSYLAVGQTQKAMENYQNWARQVQKSPSFGRKHPEMARAYNKLGDLYYKMGHVPEAEKLKEAAVGVMYPTMSAEGTLLRPRFYVATNHKDAKRNRAQLTYPDSVSIDFGSRTVPMPSQRLVRIVNVPVLDEFDFSNVELAKVQNGKGLLFMLNNEGAQRLAQLSRGGQRMSLILIVNGRAIAERPLDGQIQNGQLFTFVEIPDELLEKMVFSLKETCKQLNGGGVRREIELGRN